MYMQSKSNLNRLYPVPPSAGTVCTVVRQAVFFRTAPKTTVSPKSFRA